eukprot:749481-Hanusia_phi.AAC.24
MPTNQAATLRACSHCSLPFHHICAASFTDDPSWCGQCTREALAVPEEVEVTASTGKRKRDAEDTMLERNSIGILQEMSASRTNEVSQNSRISYTSSQTRFLQWIHSTYPELLTEEFKRRLDMATTVVASGQTVVMPTSESLKAALKDLAWNDDGATDAEKGMNFLHPPVELTVFP